MAHKRRKYFWGDDIRPQLPFPVTVESIFQGWRNMVVVEEMCFLRCSKCDKIFAILKSECQKELNCPRCNITADYIWEEEDFLINLLKRLLNSDGKNTL
jgi:phage FluMu protein Com